MTQPTPSALDEEELLGPAIALPAATFDEGPATLDDAESSELPLELRFEDAPVLGDDEDGPLGPVHETLEDDVQRAGSWLEREADALESPVALPALDVAPSYAGEDDEGPADATFELGEAPPLDARGGDGDEEGPRDAELPVILGAPAAFGFAAPTERAFVTLAERDADALAAERADALRTDDGAEVAASLAARPRGAAPVAAVRSGELLAYAFARGAGKVSRDGGERFEDARWLEGATALCASGPWLFAAIYDGPVDRCTIVRAGPAGAERVADLHAMLRSGDAPGDDEPCLVRALVALDAEGARLLVRTARRSVVISVR